MTSPVDTSVKHFDSDQTNGMTIAGQAGSMITLLDALLVNGFGSKSVTSLVVAGGVATLNFSGTHSAAIDRVILVAGATPSALNGEQKVTAITTNSVSFATAQSNQTATGTITFKMAPLGWTKVYSGTNLAAYKPSDVTATGCLLRVDDTGTTDARVVAYESMTDVNTGVKQFPTSTQMSGGLYWRKSVAADSAATGWMMFGDSKSFYICLCAYRHTAFSTATTNHQIYTFGDITSFKSGDAYSCILTGGTTATPTQNGNIAQVSSPDLGAFLARTHTAIGGSVQADRIVNAWCVDAEVSGNMSTNGLGAYPSSVDSGLRLVKMLALQNPRATYGPRGEFPGYYFCPQNVLTNVFARGTKIDGTGEFTGKVIMEVPVGPYTGTIGNTYPAFFDITGPWR